jgi:hypothetical protein
LDPIEITKITEGSSDVVPGIYRVPPYDVVGQPIPYDEHWIKNLSYTFKNLTTLKIQYVSLGMSFHYGDHDNWRSRVTWSLDVGELPPLTAETFFENYDAKAPKGTGHPLELLPGKEITIPLSAFESEVRARIEAKTPLSSVTECYLAVGVVAFDQPGLIWENFGFGWAVADPNSATGYTMLNSSLPLDVEHATWDRPPELNPEPK